MSRSDCKDSLGGPGGEVISGITCPGLWVLSGIWAVCVCVLFFVCVLLFVFVVCVTVYMFVYVGGDDQWEANG